MLLRMSSMLYRLYEQQCHLVQWWQQVVAVVKKLG